MAQGGNDRANKTGGTSGAATGSTAAGGADQSATSRKDEVLNAIASRQGSSEEITTDVVAEADRAVDGQQGSEQELTPEQVGAVDPAQVDPGEQVQASPAAGDRAKADGSTKTGSAGAHPSWGPGKQLLEREELEEVPELDRYRESVPDTYAEDVREHEAIDEVVAELDDEVGAQEQIGSQGQTPAGRAHAAAAAAGPVMAPAAGAAQPDESTKSTKSSESSQPAPVAGWGQTGSADWAEPAAQMRDHEGASLIKATWRWAAATVILFPLFALWTLPGAAMTSRAVDAGDLAGARNEASLVRLLGLISVVIFLVFAVLWLVMVIVAAAAGADAASTGVTVGTTPVVFEPGTRVSTA